MTAEYNIHIASTFTSEPVKDVLKLFMDILGIPVRVEFAAFNQVFQELLSPTSAFAQNNRGVNILLARLEDLASDSPTPDVLHPNSRELVRALVTAAKEQQVPLLFVLCPPSASALANSKFKSAMAEVENYILSQELPLSGIHFVDSKLLTESCRVSDYDSPKTQKIGAMPYTQRFYAALGRQLARFVYCILIPPPKVIVSDCDQTLWKGICGEDGPGGVAVDIPRRSLQQLLVDQSNAGALICLCSRNNEPDVWQVFNERKDMLLHREQIVAWRINWRNKSENIRSLANELQLGLDSFVFIDDDPVVCAEVEANCPEVLTICLPEDVNRVPQFLAEHWAFDRLGLTEEDSRRTAMYRANLDRNRRLQQATSFEDFLRDLDLRCEVTVMSEANIPRVAQLTQRTNQFNASGIRRTENEIRQSVATGDCRIVHVSDRFGDYGLVGAMIFSPVEHSLLVDTFVLSCRALGRGIEHRMLSALGELAEEGQKDCVVVRFVPTAKNAPVRDFLEATGSSFEELDGSNVLFRYPAAFAKEVTFRPNGFPEKKAERLVKPEAIGQTVAPRGTMSKGLSQIALELVDANAILAKVEGACSTRPKLSASYITPRSEIEQLLVNEWEQILNVQPVGVMDNFFELGGDSFSAVHLFANIEEKFGKELPLAALITNPTIRELALVMSGQTEALNDSWLYLVPLQPAGSKLPLFCMHAAGGNVLFYRDLARYLGDDQPVIGVQARELPDQGSYPNRIEDMAARYLAEVLAYQPVGPYYLCGSSFGGLVAYEMAQQLIAKGKEIALLALFDTYAPGYQPSINGVGSSLLQLRIRVTNVGEQLLQLRARDRVHFLRTRLDKVLIRARRRWLWKKNEFQIKYGEATGRELPKDLQRNHKAIQQALDCYQPQPYNGKVTLFRASKQPSGRASDATLGWSNLVRGGVELHESRGIHGAMTVDPYAGPLAQQLIRSLQLASEPELPRTLAAVAGAAAGN